TGNQSELADRARQGLRCARALNEQPGEDVEHDDADRDDGCQFGGVFVFVGQHGLKSKVVEGWEDGGGWGGCSGTASASTSLHQPPPTSTNWRQAVNLASFMGTGLACATGR